MFVSWNRSRFGGLIYACLTLTAPAHAAAQLSLATAKQCAFEQAENWPATRHLFRKLQDSLGVDPVLLVGPSGEQGAYFGRSYFHRGETVQWYVTGDGLPNSSVPEVWIDGEWVGTGWEVPLAFTIPSDERTVMLLEVKVPSDSTSAGWAVTLPLKTLCAPPAPDLPPWPASNPTNPWWVGAFHEGEAVTGMAMTLLGADGLFDKPLLVVEGFDPGLVDGDPSYGYGNMNWDAIWHCSDLDYPNTAAMPVLFDALLAEGFDLVYMDFEDGTRAAAAQAALLGHVLDLISEHSSTAGQTVVVGASMGGVIARLALRERELAGTADCVRQFITIDSPHRGAYLPIALQEALGFFAQHDVQAAELMEALNSAAARELLVLTPDGVPAEHGNLIDQLDAWGWPDGPQCLALSNGHPEVGCGDPGAALLQGNLEALGVNWAQIQLWPLPGNPYHSASTPNANVVFDCSVPNLGGDWWSDPVLEGTAWCAPTAPSWESTPASTSPHIQALQAALLSQGFELTGGTDWTAFVPVSSALDDDASEPIDRRFEPLPSAPASHCDLTGHIDFLLEYIEQGHHDHGFISADATGYPHWGHLMPHRIWMAGGMIPPGSTWTIGTPEGNGGWGMAWPAFHVRTSPCSLPLLISPSATLQVGESSGQGTGILSIERFGTLEVAAGGNLSIGSGSELIVRDGGVLQVRGDGLSFAPDARLTVEPGGRIELLETSHWHLPSGSVVNWSGQIQLAAGAIWSIQAEAGASALLQGTAALPIGSEWLIEGLTAPFDLHVSGEALLSGQGTTRWEDVHLSFAPNAALLGGSKQRWNDVYCWGDTGSTLQSSNRWRWVGGGGEHLVISHASSSLADPFFESLAFSASAIHTTADAPYARNCHFDHTSWSCDTPLEGTWENCNWLHGEELTALAIDDTQAPVHITGCSFQDCHTGIALIHAEALLACNEWKHCGQALHAQSNALAVLSGPGAGGNAFDENTVHVKFSAAPWWDCGSGNNSFGWADAFAFEGSLALPPVQGPNTFLLEAGGNFWNGAVPNWSLTSESGGQVALQTWPQVPDWNGCSSGILGPIPEASSPKHLALLSQGRVHWPTTTAGRLELVDLRGTVIREQVVGPKGAPVQWTLDGLAAGTYLIRWVPALDSGTPETVPIFWSP